MSTHYHPHGHPSDAAARARCFERYTSAAALLAAIRAAAAAAPASYCASWSDIADGAMVCPLPAGACVGVVGEGQRATFDHYPRPAVTFAYQVGSVRGSLTVAHTRDALDALHKRVHAKRRAFDGKVSRAPLPSPTVAALSAESLLREFAKGGEPGNALALADTMGEVFFGNGSGVPVLYALAERVNIGAHACIIGLQAHSGRWLVLHETSALSICGNKHGPADGVFRSAEAAREWCAAPSAEFMAALDERAPQAAPYSQEAAREAFAPDDAPIPDDAEAPADTVAVDAPAANDAQAPADPVDPAPAAPAAPIPAPADDAEAPPLRIVDVRAAVYRAAAWAIGAEFPVRVEFPGAPADDAAPVAYVAPEIAAAFGLPTAPAAPPQAPPAAQPAATPPTAQPIPRERSLSAPAADALPVLVQRAIARVDTGEDITGACAWTWHRAERALRERVDAWLVRNGHSLASLVGTGEYRFRLLVDMEHEARRTSVALLAPADRIELTIRERDCALTARGIAEFTSTDATPRNIERITQECDAMARAGRLVRLEFRGAPPAWDAPRRAPGRVTPDYATGPGASSRR